MAATPWSVTSAADVARFWGVTPRTVQNWIVEGMPRRERGGRYEYDLAAIARWRIDRSEARVTAAEAARREDAEGDTELDRKRRVEREILEMERDQLRGDLIPREEIQAGLAMLAGILRRAAETLLRRCGNDAHEILDAALTEFVERLEEVGARASVDTP